MENRLGERRIMICGEEAEIVEYVSYKNITVKFLNTGELVKCQYGNFKNGKVKSRLVASIYGVGIVGLEGIKNNNELIKSYKYWKSMLERCYSEKFQERNPTYIGCKVCDEWLYYKNFKEWYDENYYEIENETMCLDKDILFKGNKVYSPSNCVFVPKSINLLFVKSNAIRGDLPIGVSWHKSANKYQSKCNIFDMEANKYKLKYLGCYNTPEEAFKLYKVTKEKNIKQVADYYKEQIPKKLYNAMYGYKVEIID